MRSPVQCKLHQLKNRKTWEKPRSRFCISTSFQPSPGKFDLILKDLNPVPWPGQLLYSVFSAVLLCKHWTQFTEKTMFPLSHYFYIVAQQDL